ncbi:uncharacterized protein LOC115874389 [Sitophilus oryzae]|uniref:Uncharacterized protein LOC115874389 n=1 Tax=Sitophilus oryzae TaxID=7048 RepID=A0A6J2X339_SITOR|nr:uncharacterized protein LOC115874389 [Sitophilus oryzae]
MVKMRSPTSTNNHMEHELEKLQVQLTASVLSLKDEIANAYTQKLDDLKENLTNRLEAFKELLNTQKAHAIQHSLTPNDEGRLSERSECIPVTAEAVRVAVSDALGSLYSSKLRDLTKPNKEIGSTGAVLRGSGNDGLEDFRGEVGRTWLYIGRVTEKSNEEAVKNFIKRKINMNDSDVALKGPGDSIIITITIMKTMLEAIIHGGITIIDHMNAGRTSQVEIFQGTIQNRTDYKFKGPASSLLSECEGHKKTLESSVDIL